MSDVMAANPQHYSMGGFSYGTLCNATASPVPPSQMGVCELFNHTDYSQTDNNETNLSYPTNDVSDHKEADAIRKREDYRRYFREELGIDELKAEYPSNADMIEELFELIVDTVCSSRSFIRIGKENLPAEIVRSRMMKLNAEHIRYLISCLNENTTKIRDIRQYLLTALYNAPATISSYYNQLVQYDMANGLI